jgi:hypothetical protein
LHLTRGALAATTLSALERYDDRGTPYAYGGRGKTATMQATTSFSVRPASTPFFRTAA